MAWTLRTPCAPMLDRSRAWCGCTILVLLLTEGLTSSASAATTAEGRYAAVVMQISGQGAVVRGNGTREPARPGQFLAVGDWLVLGPGTGAVLAYADRPCRTIPRSRRGTCIQIAPPAVLPPRSAVARMWKLLLDRLRPARTTVVAASSLDSQAGLSLSPADSLERRLPVAFSWSGKPGATYLVSVYDGDSLLWQSTQLRATSCQYGSSAPELRAGRRYEWDLRASWAGGMTRSPRVWFELLAEADRTRVAADLAEATEAHPNQPDPVARHLSRAILLTAEGLIAEAAEEARAAQRLRPHDEGLQQSLQSLLLAPLSPDR